MTYLGLVLRNIGGVQPRSFATAGGILIAVASLVALIGLARGVAATLSDSLDARQVDVVMIEAGTFDLMSSVVPDTLAQEAAREPGIAAAIPELARLTTLADGRSVAVLGWPIDAFTWDGLELVAGRLPVAGDTHVAVVGAALADRLGLGPGEPVTLFHIEFTVIGTVTAPSLLGRNFFYLPLPTMQQVTFRDGVATSVVLQLAPGTPSERDTTLANLRARFAAYEVEPTEDLIEQYRYAQIAEILSLSISTVALLSAVLVIFNTMSMSVSERRGEIAIMSAVGWTRGRIVAVLLAEATLLSLVAGAAGCALGAVFARTVVRLPATAGFIDPQISAGLILWAMGLSACVGLLGALAPALGATSRSPAEVLRDR